LPGILEIAHQLLLFGIDADHRLACGLVRRSLEANVAELPIALGRLLATHALDVGMQAVLVGFENPANDRLAELSLIEQPPPDMRASIPSGEVIYV
jgi:hypothetical protein